MTLRHSSMLEQELPHVWEVRRCRPDPRSTGTSTYPPRRTKSSLTGGKCCFRVDTIVGAIVSNMRSTTFNAINSFQQYFYEGAIVAFNDNEYFDCGQATNNTDAIVGENHVSHLRRRSLHFLETSDCHDDEQGTP